MGTKANSVLDSGAARAIGAEGRKRADADRPSPRTHGQNFTFLVAMRARFGFIVDILRGNLLLHLPYKALFDLSPDRVTFLSRLFSRPPPTLPDTATVADLLDAFVNTSTDSEAVLRQKMDDVRSVLSGRFASL